MGGRIAVAAALVWLWPGSAAGFQIETGATHGCHEHISAVALAAEGWPDGVPPPLDDEGHLVVDDLPFTVSDDARDAWTMALLIGVRSNDIGANDPFDVAALVHIHNDPDDQPAHCIRRVGDDGPAGDAGALAACRQFILAELEAGGFFADPFDTAATESIGVFLAFRGRVDIDVVSFAYHLGRAVHALEDGFTHTFRAPVDGRVRHVLNWIDFATSDDYDEAVDGYAHLAKLDDCTRDSAGAIRRITLATAAVRGLLAALRAPTPGARRAAVEAALDAAFALEPGCTAANRWCGAAELAEVGGCGCGAAPAHGGALLAVAVTLLLRRRRRRSGLAALLLVLALAGPAAADHPSWRRFALTGNTGVSLDRGAGALGVGARWYRFQRLGFGVDLEWNPFFSFTARRVAPGTFNAYGTVIYRWYTSDTFELHSKLHVGTSTLLFELVGVDAGSTGLYLGANPIGIALRLGKRWHLTIDPSDLAMPIPQLTGFPFYYRQYRISVGLEWRLG